AKWAMDRPYNSISCSVCLDCSKSLISPPTRFHDPNSGKYGHFARGNDAPIPSGWAYSAAICVLGTIILLAEMPPS
ncbi:MAG: hypothetical protein AAGM67_05340, partial [Bacteroidota bacterium]